MKFLCPLFLLIAIPYFCQSQDQILDGIGETHLVARYRFNGDVQDASRSRLHAKGLGLSYVADKRFGRVLALQKDVAITPPSTALENMDALSISAWIKLEANHHDRNFLTLGSNTSLVIRTVTIGLKPALEVELKNLTAPTTRMLSKDLPMDRWIHLVLVVDMAGSSIQFYIDKQWVGELKPLDALPLQAGETPDLVIGKGNERPGIDCLLYDFRIYRVALREAQVAAIYQGAAGASSQSTVNVGPAEAPLPTFAPHETALYYAYLTKVNDVTVETELGTLPRLPAHVKGTYREGISGPPVRVIWPAPTDNRDVLQPGSYTVKGTVPGTAFQPTATVRVTPQKKTPERKAQLELFPLNAVTLLLEPTGEPSRFTENSTKFLQGLAETNPDRFLYMFRDAYGQPQPPGAQPLKGWDAQDTKLRGHATGHYLSALAQAYASSSNAPTLQKVFKTKMEYVVNELHRLTQLSGKARMQGGSFEANPAHVPPGPGKQSYDSDLSSKGIRHDYWNWGEGYISAYPPDQFIMLEQGAKYGSQPHQIWAPYYTLHKILAGLLDVYEVSGHENALQTASAMANWVHARLSALPQDTLLRMWSKYIAGEFGGINEALARLYKESGDSKHLETARLFDNIRLFYGDGSHGLARNVDTFRGLHANQHIPQIVGSLAMYEVGLGADYYKIAENFWYRAVNDYAYSIGGVAGARQPANAECFTAQPASLYANGLSVGGQNETCATYNLLKLTEQLFRYTPRAELMDYYERALYNHILASVAEHTPGNTYHVPLGPGAVKHFGNHDMSGFSCCNGTALESNTKFQSAIYYKNGAKQLYVNLFIPSSVHWEENNVTLTQSTSFPKEDQIVFTVQGKGTFDLLVRVPGWASNGFKVWINGKAQRTQSAPGTYLKIARKWKDGDVVKVEMPLEFRWEGLMDQPNIASLFYGPLLLAAQEQEALKTWRTIHLPTHNFENAILREGTALNFMINGIRFKPFYDTYGRHSAYLDVRLQE